VSAKSSQQMSASEYGFLATIIGYESGNAKVAIFGMDIFGSSKRLLLFHGYRNRFWMWQRIGAENELKCFKDFIVVGNLARLFLGHYDNYDYCYYYCS